MDDNQRFDGLKTWENVKGWGDILAEEEKKIMREVIAKADMDYPDKICPYLGRIEQAGVLQFIYCGERCQQLKSRILEAGCRAPTESSVPQLSDPRYISYIDSAALQLFCIGNFNRCINFPKS